MKKLLFIAILAAVVAGVSSCKKGSGSDALVSTMWKWNDGDESRGQILIFISSDNVSVSTFGYTGENSGLNGESTLPYKFDGSKISIAWNGWEESPTTATGTVEANRIVFEEWDRAYVKYIMQLPEQPRPGEM